MRWTLIAAAAVALGATSGCSHEQSAMKPASEVYNQASGVREGTVASATERKLVLIDPKDQDGAGMVLETNDNTDWVRGGQRIKVNQVKEGAPVRVYYAEPSSNGGAMA